MKAARILFNTSIPLFIILYAWLTGTTSKEYWNRFKTVEGKLQGPYTLIKVKHELVFNDSIRLMDEGYNMLINDLRALEMEEKLYSITKPRMTKLQDFNLDSLTTPLSKAAWDQLKEKYEKPVDRVDTVFENRNGSKEVSIAIWQKIYATPYFSVSGHPDKFTISEYNDSTKEKDKYGLTFKFEYSFSPSKIYTNWEAVNDYNARVSRGIGKETKKVSVTRLQGLNPNARAYIIKNKNGDELFYDEYGFEALKMGSFNVFGSEANENFILWYDNIIIKLLAGIQLIAYVGLGLYFWDNRMNEKAENSM